METLLAILEYQGTPIPSSNFRRNTNFRGRALNIGSISPDATGSKRSRLEVGTQLRFRVWLCVVDWKCYFDLFWNIDASCTTMSGAHETKMRPDGFSDATNGILPSCASLHRRDVNIVHLLPWLWRKQQIKEGCSLISGSMKLTPHLHDAKHLCTNLSRFNQQGSFFIKHHDTNISK